MHLEKYKITAVANMTRHYERSSQSVLNRVNIDEDRTHLNYCVYPNFDFYSDFKNLKNEVERQNNRKVRKDAVVMSDIVLTLPQNIKSSDIELFFKESTSFLHAKLQSAGLADEALVQSYVHLDETTPHMHFSFTPLIKNSKNNLNFSFDRLISRNFYRSIHEELNEYLTTKLGYNAGVLLEDEHKLKSLNKNDQKEFIKVKDEIQKEKKELLAEKKVLKSKLENFEKKSINVKLNLIQKLQELRVQKRLLQELENLESELIITRENYKNSENERQKALEKLEGSKSKLVTVTQRLEIENNNYINLKTQLSNLENELTLSKLSEIEELQQQLASLETELEVVESKSERLSQMSLSELVSVSDT